MAINIYGNNSDSGLIYHINNSYWKLNKTMEKLSSGLAINRASDDPAGLLISENMRSRIASLNQEIENISMQICKYQTADASLGEFRSLLNDLRSEAISASNEGFNSEEAQEVYNTTAQSIVHTYNQIVETAEYNGKNLFDGGEGSLAELSILTNIDLSTAESAQHSIEIIDGYSSQLDDVQGRLGSYERYELSFTKSNLEVSVQNLRASESEIRDADYLQEISNMVKDQIAIKVGMALLAHTYLDRNSVFKLLQ